MTHSDLILRAQTLLPSPPCTSSSTAALGKAELPTMYQGRSLTGTRPGACSQPSQTPTFADGPLSMLKSFVGSKSSPSLPKCIKMHQNASKCDEPCLCTDSTKAASCEERINSPTHCRSPMFSTSHVFLALRLIEVMAHLRHAHDRKSYQEVASGECHPPRL